MTKKRHTVDTVWGTENPATFTGKEWCKSQWLAQRGLERGISETGYSYFGARYYDSDLSGLFLSVDPMADKYPSISPYAYCAWNPVKLVDPNWCEVGDYYDRNGLWLGTDGINDNIAYAAKSVTKNSKGFVISADGAQKLSITNEELLDRATWVCGEWLSSVARWWRCKKVCREQLCFYQAKR